MTFFAGSGQVETSGSGTIVALNGAVTATLPTAASIVFNITGTWVATLIFEGSVDGTTFFTIPTKSLPLTLLLNTTAANGNFSCSVGGYFAVRVRASAFTSGTATVVWNADNNPNPTGTLNTMVGGTDGTAIGNVSDRVKTSTDIASISGSISASFSSKTRMDLVTVAINLATGSFTNVYSYSGSGYLIGYSLEFNNAAIIPRMQVDGETVYTGQTLSALGAFTVTSNTTDRRQNGQGLVLNGSNLDFSFRSPIRFTSSVTLSADANGGVIFTRQLSQAVIYIVKET